MNLHLYGRSLKLAVSRYPAATNPRLRIQIFTRTGTIQNNLGFRGPSARSIRTEATDRDVFVDGDTDPTTRGSSLNKSKALRPSISQEDLDFISKAKHGHYKELVRWRKYHDSSILPPDSYEILASLSRIHNRDKVGDVDIPRPQSIQTLDTEVSQDMNRPISQPIRSKEPPTLDGEGMVIDKRSQETVESHRTLFKTIDIGTKRGAKGWQDTFYLVACVEGHKTLDFRTRACAIRYLARRYVEAGYIEDIISLYTTVQNSWLEVKIQKEDATALLGALFESLSREKSLSTVLITKVLETYTTACKRFDPRYTLLFEPGLEVTLAPALMVFMATHLPLSDVFTALSAQATNLRDSGNDSLITRLYGILTRRLLEAQNISWNSELTGKNLQAYYRSQSIILNMLSSVPRSESSDITIAKAILDHAISLAEIIEARKLIVSNGKLEDVQKLQKEILRSVHRVSQNTKPGSIQARHAVEFLSEFLYMTSGSKLPLLIGPICSLYARLGAITALERFLAKASDEQHQGRKFNLPASQSRDVVECISRSIRARQAAGIYDAQNRGADLILQMWRIYFATLSPGIRLDQHLLRDMVGVLARYGASSAIKEIWEAAQTVIPRGSVRTGTVEAVISALSACGDVSLAKNVFSEMVESMAPSPPPPLPSPGATASTDEPQAHQKRLVTASTINPFLPSHIPKERRVGRATLFSRELPLILDDVIKLGIDGGVEWGSVAHLYGLRQLDSASPSEHEQSRIVTAWAEELQGCAREVNEARKGIVNENTLVKVEQVFAE